MGDCKFEDGQDPLDGNVFHMLRIAELKYLIQCEISGNCAVCDKMTVWRLLIGDIHVCGKICYEHASILLDQTFAQGHGKLGKNHGK